MSENEMPKEIWCDKTDCGSVVVIDKDYWGGETAYIRKDEHERLISVCESYHEKKIAEKDAEIAEIKKQLKEYTKRISIEELDSHLNTL